VKIIFRKWLVAGILSVLVFLQISCAIFKPFKKESGSDAFFESKAQITVSSPDMSLNFSATIQFTLSDSFHIEVKGPFGISAGDVFIINGRFIYINKLERIVLSGENSDGLLESVFQIPIEPNILSKLPLLPHLLYEKQLTLQGMDGFKNIKVNKKQQVTAAELETPDSKIDFTFTDFKKREQIAMAHKIVLKNESTQQYLQISFKDIKKVKKKFPELPIIDNSYNQL
jgi:hypothetical protein